MSGVVAPADIRRAVSSVEDPELPFVTIEELGILRGVDIDDGRVTVTITPTYSGCPAMEAIRDAILSALDEVGVGDAEVQTRLSPAWTTDDISDEGRRKLEAGGIAPPRAVDHVSTTPVLCPQCRDSATHVVSEFGSTACKALRVCDSCGEPFDHFKEL